MGYQVIVNSTVLSVLWQKRLSRLRYQRNAVVEGFHVIASYLAVFGANALYFFLADDVMYGLDRGRCSIGDNL